MLLTARQDTPATYADMRVAIDAICTYLLIPCLGGVPVLGLLSVATHKPFLDLRWVWVKALLGISTFEGTLIVIHGRAKPSAVLADRIAKGEAEPAALANLVATEWSGLVQIGAIAIASIVLGVWRPG